MIDKRFRGLIDRDVMVPISSGEAHIEGILNCEIALFGPFTYLQGLNQDGMVYR